MEPIFAFYIAAAVCFTAYKITELVLDYLLKKEARDRPPTVVG